MLQALYSEDESSISYKVLRVSAPYDTTIALNCYESHGSNKGSHFTASQCNTVNEVFCYLLSSNYTGSIKRTLYAKGVKSFKKMYIYIYSMCVNNIAQCSMSIICIFCAYHILHALFAIIIHH